MKNTVVITFANQKGGCSKTTSTLNVAYCLAQTYKKKVLVLDLDSQASLSLDVGLDVDVEDLNTIDQLLGAYVNREINEFKWDDVKNFIYTPTFSTRKKIDGKWQNSEEEFGFDVIPSSTDLAMLDLQVAMRADENKGHKIYLYYIKDLIDCIKANSDYDFILADTAPALGSLTANAMAASLTIIIPSNLELMSFRGIHRIKDTVDFIQSSVQSQGLEHRGILGILLSSYSLRRSVDKALEQYVHDFYPTPTFQTQIRDSSDARRAVAEGHLFAQINKKAREDYDKACEEIMFALEDPEGWKKKADKVWNEVKKAREKEGNK